MHSHSLANLPVQREPVSMSKFEMPVWNRVRYMIKSIEPSMPTPADEPESYVDDISAADALAEVAPAPATSALMAVPVGDAGSD